MVICKRSLRDPRKNATACVSPDRLREFLAGGATKGICPCVVICKPVTPHQHLIQNKTLCVPPETLPAHFREGAIKGPCEPETCPAACGNATGRPGPPGPPGECECNATQIAKIVMEILRNETCDCPPTFPCICVDRECPKNGGRRNGNTFEVCLVFRDEATGRPLGTFETVCVNETEADRLVEEGGHLEGACECSRLCPNGDDCGCEGKVTKLKLQYNGGNAGVVTVRQKNPDVVIFGPAPLQPGDMFTINGTDNKGTLSTEITLFVDGEEDARIHTSCSVPIGPGLVAGSFEVISGESRTFDGPLCPVEDCDGKDNNTNNNNEERLAFVCHRSQTIQVSESAVPSHLGHGDSLGRCPTRSIGDRRYDDDDVSEGEDTDYEDKKRASRAWLW